MLRASKIPCSPVWWSLLLLINGKMSRIRHIFRAFFLVGHTKLGRRDDVWTGCGTREEILPHQHTACAAVQLWIWIIWVSFTAAKIESHGMKFRCRCFDPLKIQIKRVWLSLQLFASVDWLISWQAASVSYHSIDWLIDWFLGGSIERLIDWLIDWLINFTLTTAAK